MQHNFYMAGTSDYLMHTENSLKEITDLTVNIYFVKSQDPGGDV